MTHCNYEFTRYLKSLLPKKADRQFLLKCLSHMCEKSYRRGVQQAIEMTKREEILDKFFDSKKLVSWRFGDLGKSPGLDGYYTSARDRFLMENQEWYCIDA